jgi:hypothetical protein
MSHYHFLNNDGKFKKCDHKVTPLGSLAESKLMGWGYVAASITYDLRGVG